MQKNVRCLLLSPNDEPKIVTIEEDYREIKKVLEIESPVTCVHRMIGDKEFDLWVDDEGLLKGGLEGVAYCKNACEVLVGKCLIANNVLDEMESLTDEDIHLIQEELYFVSEDKVIDYNGQQVVFKKGGVFVGYNV